MVRGDAARAGKKTHRLWSSLLVVALVSGIGSGRLRGFVGGQRLGRDPDHAARPALAKPKASADPWDFDRALLSELRALKDFDPSTMTLRERIMEFKTEERQGKIADKLLQEARSHIQQMEVPLLSSLRRESSTQGGESGDQSLTGAQLKRLATQLYTEDAMPLVQQHVLGIIEPWDHLVRDYTLQLSLFQVAQVYSMSAFFGYALRQAELRYGLEKAAGDAEAATLSDYVTSLDSEVLLMSARMTLEAQQAMKQQVTELCGEPDELWQRLIDAVGPSSGSDEDLTRLRQAIANGKVESVPVSVSSLRHIALEGVALGFLLSRAEANSSQELTLAPSGEAPRLLGAFKSTWGFLGRVDGKRYLDL